MFLLFFHIHVVQMYYFVQIRNKLLHNKQEKLSNYIAYMQRRVLTVRLHLFG